MTLGLVFLGPVLVVATFTAGPLNQNTNSPTLRLILLSDLVYVLVVAALVRRGSRIADRRSRSAGSRLHLRPASSPAWRWCRRCWSPSSPCCR